MRFMELAARPGAQQGLDQVKGDIVVALDANTLFPPSTIARLRRAGSPTLAVGAVAGNALVGNRRNLVTRWQALEMRHRPERRTPGSGRGRRGHRGAGRGQPGGARAGATRRLSVRHPGGRPGPDHGGAARPAGGSGVRSGRALRKAPETVEGLLESSGSAGRSDLLRCLWKYRTSTCLAASARCSTTSPCRRSGCSGYSQPTAAPLVDLAVIWNLISATLDRFYHPVEWSSGPAGPVAALPGGVHLRRPVGGGAGHGAGRRAPWGGNLQWIRCSSSSHRQLMYYVVVKAVVTRGAWPEVAWGKLERRATAAVEKDALGRCAAGSL